MRVTDLERRSPVPEPHLNDAVLDSCRTVEDQQVLSGAQIDDIIRACLREYAWCRLKGPGGAYLHFGYDFYMYVGVLKSAKMLDLPRAIFLEEFESPYMSLGD